MINKAMAFGLSLLVVLVNFNIKAFASVSTSNEIKGMAAGINCETTGAEKCLKK